MKRILMILICALVLAGCGSKTVSEVNRFEESEDEKYNDVDAYTESYEETEIESESLEETESDIEILSKHTYSIGDDKIHISFGQNEDEYSLNVTCEIEDKVNALSTHIYLNEIMNTDESELKKFIDTFNFSYSIFMGDGSVLIGSPELSMAVSKDGELLSIEDCFVQELQAKQDSEEEMNFDYGAQVIDFLMDFIENY